MSFPKLVAFAGYAGAGKDEAAKALLEIGYTRRNFGDYIKAELDPLVQQCFGFSAFTEVRERKSMIRAILEQWGEARYDALLARMLEDLPERCVNTHLL